MAQRDLLDAFNDCIDRMANGQPLDAVLRAYPEYAEQLAPMLRTAEAARTATALPPLEVAAARERVRARLLDVMAEAPPYVEPRPLLAPMFRRALAAAAVLLIVGFLGVLLFNREAPPAIIETLTPATETQSATAEASQTMTATASETLSPTPTFTGTGSITPSATATDTATQTPTATETPTATDTGTSSPTATATVTRTASATATPTMTRTATVSPAPSETVRASATACVKLQPLNWVTYRVRSGDTLSQLAQATGSTTAALIRVNCLSSTAFLITGSSLLLPRQPYPVTVMTPAATSVFVPPTAAPQVFPTVTPDDDDDDGDDDHTDEPDDDDDDDRTDEPDDDDNDNG